MAKPHSPRFVRLGRLEIDALLGSGAALRPRIEISGGRFVSRERVSIVGVNGRLDGVAVVGPAEESVKLRLAQGDVERLGLDSTGGLLLVGPSGEARIVGGIESAA